MAEMLHKEKKISDTVAFAVNEEADISSVRKRKVGLVCNAKAYKVPKDILGDDLCSLIEYCKYI